jgi:hypothetical protein
MFHVPGPVPVFLRENKEDRFDTINIRSKLVFDLSNGFVNLRAVDISRYRKLFKRADV